MSRYAANALSKLTIGAQSSTNLAGYYRRAERYNDAVNALDEVVALDERTGHEDLDSDRAALEQARWLASLSPKQREALTKEAAAQAQMQAFIDQVRDAAIAALHGQSDAPALIAQLDEAAAQAAADEPPDSPRSGLAAYLLAVAALLGGKPAPEVPAAFAPHLEAIKAARDAR